MRTRLLVLLAAAVLIAAAGCGGAQTGENTSLTFTMELLQPDNDDLIYGIVYDDLNGDGVRDVEEPGLAGATVTLVGVTDMTTGSDGFFSFDVTEAGTYTVHGAPPPGYEMTTLDDFEVDVVDTPQYVEFGAILVEVYPPVDVKPGSDVNPLNLRSRGVLPVAILGSETFDVTMIDPATLRLNGVVPLRWSYEDVCGEEAVTMDADMDWDDSPMPDGYDDLTLKFLTQDIVMTLGDVQRGEMVTLTMTGQMLDGTMISGDETVRIVQVPK